MKTKTFPLKGLAFSLTMVWSVIILASGVWNQVQHVRELDHILRQMGRTSIERDILYRLWNSRHGGLYAPVTETNPPNPYLTPEMTQVRDLKISPELTLTMVNPAYMTRQVYELARETHAISGHITSLKPINPVNKADPWEEKALQIVEKGAGEYSEKTMVDSQSHFRMMLPLRTEKPCLKCHAVHGYQEGDVRGGISVTLPLESYYASQGIGEQALLLGHFFLWVIGMGAILWGYTILARVEAERKAAEKKIHHLAHYDQLTGLVSRNLFHDRVNQALAMARRLQNMAAFLYIDLDRFKPVNDTFGHEAGDDVLREVARRLKDSVRATDTIARMGGDEFVVILLHLNEPDQAAPVAEKILAAISRPFPVRGKECFLGASIGISCFPKDGQDMDTLLKNADAAMYRVKGGKGGGFAFS